MKKTIAQIVNPGDAGGLNRCRPGRRPAERRRKPSPRRKPRRPKRRPSPRAPRSPPRLTGPSSPSAIRPSRPGSRPRSCGAASRSRAMTARRSSPRRESGKRRSRSRIWQFLLLGPLRPRRAARAAGPRRQAGPGGRARSPRPPAGAEVRAHTEAELAERQLAEQERLAKRQSQ